jgi:maintenance of morphology protein 1
MTGKVEQSTRVHVLTQNRPNIISAVIVSVWQSVFNLCYSQTHSGLSFTQGFLLGQLSVALLIVFFIKFFIFGEAPSDIYERRQKRRQQRRSFSQSARPDITGENYATSNKRISSIIRPSPALTTAAILAKTYYNVNGHQPESVDWFNVLFAQTIAQLRSDAQQDNAILTSLNTLLNGPKKPEFLDEIKVTEISLGEEFPIFSNCRVIPVEDSGKDGNAGGRLQARMDVDLSDAVTLGIETKLVLNYPRPLVAVMPVALAVSVVRFSGTLSISFIPSPSPPTYPSASPTTATNSAGKHTQMDEDDTPIDPTPPTTLTFSFLPDYRLELSTHSLLGSRSRLQDVPKIAQLVEARLHDWFDERCVEPRFQQVVLPSLWPRKRNTRGGDVEREEEEANENKHVRAPSKGQHERSIPGSFEGAEINLHEAVHERDRSVSHSARPQHAVREHSRVPEPREYSGFMPNAADPPRRNHDNDNSNHDGNNTTSKHQPSQRPQTHVQRSFQQIQHQTPAESLLHRRRYQNTYEGEVQSSPPRDRDDYNIHHDDDSRDEEPAPEFVSGRDLEQKLKREQIQRRREGMR